MSDEKSPFDANDEGAEPTSDTASEPTPASPTEAAPVTDAAPSIEPVPATEAAPATEPAPATEDPPVAAPAPSPETVPAPPAAPAPETAPAPPAAPAPEAASAPPAPQVPPTAPEAPPAPAAPPAAASGPVPPAGAPQPPQAPYGGQPTPPAHPGQPPHPGSPAAQPAYAPAHAGSAQHPGHPGAPAPAGGPSFLARTGISPERFGFAAIGGAIAVGAALVASIVLILLVLLISSIVGEFSFADLGDINLSALAPVVWGAILGLGGQFNGSASFSGGSVSATAFVVPVVVLVLAIGAAAWWSFRRQRATPASASGRWLLAGTAGLAAAIISLLVSLIGISNVDTEIPFVSSVSGSASTLSFGTFFGPLILITAATALGSWLAGDGARGFFGALWNAPNRFRWGTRDVYDYLAVLTVLFVPFTAIVSFFLDDNSGLLVPHAIGQLTIAMIAVGHFGGLTLNASASIGAGQSEALTLFSGGAPGWIWITLILAVLSAVVAAVAIAARRVTAPSPISRAWVVPAGVAVLAVLIGYILGGVYLSGGASGMGVGGLGFSVTIAPVGWTVLIALLWGAIVEALARFVAPAIITALPALGGLRLAAAAPAAPAAPGTSPTRTGYAADYGYGAAQPPVPPVPPVQGPGPSVPPQGTQTPPLPPTPPAPPAP